MFGRWAASPIAAVLLSLGILGSAVAVPASAAGVVRPEEGEVERLYLAVLGRNSEPGGFEYWVIRRQTGTSLARVAAFFLASDEYRARFIPEGAEAEDDETFVTRVYQLVLGRAPDPGGFRYWLDRLDGGLSRPALVLHFSESIEFRRRTGTDLADLPPFHAAVAPVTTAELGASWQIGCPVGPSSLRSLTVSHVGSDGAAAEGTLVVHADAVADTVVAFARLYAARFPIERIQPVSVYGGDDDASMADNNTSAFNCRPVTGGSGWSRHAFGRAVDINPLVNPYVRGGLGSPDSVVLPPGGGDYLDRGRYHPMMIREGDVVVTAFDSLGWTWGGRWLDPYDPQHFDSR